jgi:hypothetical protein
MAPSWSTLALIAVQVPDDLAGDITNVTATGQSYVEFKFKNVTTTDTFQVSPVRPLLPVGGRSAPRHLPTSCCEHCHAHAPRLMVTTTLYAKPFDVRLC